MIWPGLLERFPARRDGSGKKGKMSFGSVVLENIETFAIRGYPECRSAPSPVFVAGIEYSFVTKVIIADQCLFFSADRTGSCHLG
jgi:hypothetical protein